MTQEMPRHAEVLVVGAGMAGLAATAALAKAGVAVTLLERKPFIGGRAYSYQHPSLAEEVDSQHIVLGCCTNFVDLCAQAGIVQKLRWYESIPLLEPATANRPTRRSDIAPGMLPAPSHSTMSFLRAHMLGPADKVAVARGLMHFLRGYPETDAEPFSAWLQRTNQTERAIRHFWEPVVLAALNDGFERSSTRYVGKVLHEMLLRNPEGVRFGIPTEPLTNFFGAFLELAEHYGASAQLRTGVEALQPLPGGGWRVFTSGGSTVNAEQVVLALPFEQTARLLQGLPASEPVNAVLQSLAHFSHAPITTIHLWFDRPVTDLATAGLLDTRIQWLFNKSGIRQADPAQGQYLELTISGSFPELSMSREEILQPAIEELARFFPEVRSSRLQKAGVLKEARATFSVIPGLDAYRPAADVLGMGLFLAGDWTRTGWPATMEGGVRSGRLAAEAVLAAQGRTQSVLSPDLPASGFMRWISRA